MTRFAPRGGQRLSYAASGSPAGSPVLALHDLLADRGQFRQVTGAPAPASLRWMLPDARGHGASPTLSVRQYLFAELAADALAVLDAAGLPAAHIAAIGWGAATALTLAATAPERVTSLVLLDPYLPGLLALHPEQEARQAGQDHFDAIREAATAADKGLTDRALDRYLDVRLGVGWRDHLPKPRLGAIRRAAVNLGPLLAGMAEQPIDRTMLARIEAPVTLLTRDDAPDVERWVSEALAELLSTQMHPQVKSIAAETYAPEAIAELLVAQHPEHRSPRSRLC
jgi:pimeloyl-ACP methyl ester carboxylesterase